MPRRVVVPYEEIEQRFVPVEWERDDVPVWGDGLFYDKMSPVSCRLSDKTISEMRGLCSRVPGLTDSGTVRFLSVVGLEVMRCVERYAPGVLDDAIRDGDAALSNVQRLASMVCPLVASCFDEALMVEAGESDV